MLFKEIIAIYSENHMQLYIQNEELLINEAGGTLGFKGLIPNSQWLSSGL
jgi:hypothetical protein